MVFTYLKVKSAKCLCLLSSGLGLGLKNLFVFTNAANSDISVS